MSRSFVEAGFYREVHEGREEKGVLIVGSEPIPKFGFERNLTEQGKNATLKAWKI